LKKDYVPVSDNDSELSESSFVEQFWTQVWTDSKLLEFSAKRIEERDEFKIIKPYLASLPSKSRILDGGCGLGEWTIYLASRGFDVVGLDISKMTVEKLKQKFPDKNFRVGDLRSTEFDDGYFDSYLSWGTFEHFEEGFGSPIREARRILRDGGYLFISVPYQNSRHLHRDKRDLWFWDENYQRNCGYHKKMRFYQWRLTKSELQREFEINGFRTLALEAIQKGHGIRRAVQHDLHINPNTVIGKALRVLLYLFTPRGYAAHMIIGIGQKI
jgi:SAM-dependent methyltransferase